ncbi:hypothetical protein C8R45DRAFT_307516 [Mycena sanguinolenta]|nr:hypothetical protein C8R45DRAFT_307516 [Mycena sanguinolenta]
MTESPTLPPELEQTIFELTALSFPRSIPRLMLVAWRVKSWVEPLLYRTITVDPYTLYGGKKETCPFPIPSGTLLSLIHSKPSTFFRSAVRHLYLAHSVAAEEDSILAACTGIENLWLAAQTSLIVLDIRFDRPLKRLHGALKCIFESYSKINFTHSVLASLTHLDIFDFPPAGVDMAVWGAITSLPHLTHLAFNDTEYLPMCGALFPGWERLRVLVILFFRNDGNLNAELFAKFSLPKLAEEPRIVLMALFNNLDDWICGAHRGCGDYWSRAEAHIANRKSGRIGVRECYVPNEDD